MKTGDGNCHLVATDNITDHSPSPDSKLLNRKNVSKNISIIIIANDSDTILRTTLPEILAQQHDATFEVIVVRETPKGELIDIIEPFLRQHDNLYTTFLPDKPIYATDEEISILLGVKAAKNDDIVIIHPAFMPADDNWLKDVSSLLDINEEFPVLFGNAHYCDKGFFVRRKHKKHVKKILKQWCKSKGLKCKDMFLSKGDRQDLAISFHRKDYLSDFTLRNIIATHYDIK